LAAPHKAEALVGKMSLIGGKPRSGGEKRGVRQSKKRKVEGTGRKKLVIRGVRQECGRAVRPRKE